MVRSRAWNLRLNIDDMNAAMYSLSSPEDYKEFLVGMMLAVNGGMPRYEISAPASLGFDIGHDMLTEAHGYLSRKSSAGHASAEVRKLKHGSAQPQRVSPRTDPEQTSNTVRTDLEHCSNTSRTGPEQTPNQSTIYNLQSTNNNPPPPTPSGGSRKGRRVKTKTDSLLDASPEVISAVEQIAAATPKQDGQERTIRKNNGELLVRLEERLKEHPEATPEIMVQAWKDYLASSPKYIKAPQYFFGQKEDQSPNGAHWYGWAKAIYVRMKKLQAKQDGE